MQRKNRLGLAVTQIFSSPTRAPKSILRPTPTTLGALLCAGMVFAAQAETNTLPTVTVNANSEAETGYLPTETRVGKVLQDPQDVPQAVTTVTHQLMQDQQVGSLREALRNVSGLTFNAAEGGRAGDNMMLRGFYTFGDMYLDGIRDTAQYNRETFNLEQIDVLRGSAAMLFGRGQAGGVINQVSKTPKLQDKTTLSASLGSNDYQEVKADLNQTLGETSAIRFNVMNRDEGSWRENPANGDETELHRSGIALALATGINTEHELGLNFQRISNRDVPDYGLPFDSTKHRVSTDYPAETFWGIDATFDDSDTDMTTLSHTWRIAPGTQLHTQLRDADYERAYWAKAPSATVPPDATGGGTSGSNKTRYAHYETSTVQSDFSTRFGLGGMSHELLIGGEYLKEKNTRTSLLNLGTNAAPEYHPDVFTTADPTTFKGTSKALYIQDSVEFVENWTLLLGVRHDQLDAEYSSLTSPKLSFSEDSVRSGLSYQPNTHTHYYLSWSDSFSPTADLYQLSGNEYPPERSKTTELGAKWLFLDGDLAFRTALYRADKEWERNTDVESTASILTKKRRTDGIEFELVGRITPNWEIFSGLALMDAKIIDVAENRNATTLVVTHADERLAGQQARNTPDYTFNLWTTYKVGGGWKVGVGAEAKGERLVYSPSTTNADSLFTDGEFNPNTAPAYTRWDAMLAYEQKTWAVRLNLRNLNDEVYYDSLYDNGGFAVPGPRRSFIVTTEIKF